MPTGATFSYHAVLLVDAHWYLLVELTRSPFRSPSQARAHHQLARGPTAHNVSPQLGLGGTTEEAPREANNSRLGATWLGGPPEPRLEVEHILETPGRVGHDF